MGITDLVDIPKNINHGISPARQITMVSLLGNPRGSYNQTCQQITNPVLQPLVVTDNVGPFRVTGLTPAVESLKEVMSDIRQQEFDVYQALGTEGMLCVRFVRGSRTSISNHSWGTAIDLKLNGQLDKRGDNRVQVGLTKIAPIFNYHGWFWGVDFSTEDSMHMAFQSSKGLAVDGIVGKQTWGELRKA